MEVALTTLFRQAYPEARTDEKRRRMADRIAGRTLYHFREGELSTPTRGGRFGGTTTPDPEIYESVAGRLLNAVEEIEIRVHRIHRTDPPAAPYQGYNLVDVISVATMNGFPKYLARNPVTNPGAFVSTEFSDVTVTQIYPPVPESDPSE
ncbi:MAG TPA: hypothetical protein VN554_00570 [Verrucomicrobiae bacterium]|nr:hypothetical protein [Verrucomicrobiae bacterium]